MMKKRILIGTLAAVMALSTGSAFADTVSSTPSNDDGNRQEQRAQRQEERQEKREDRQEKMEEIIAQYYPEISDDWSGLRTDIDETRDAIRELVKPEEGERPERPDFENMTDEEIEAYKEEMKETFGKQKPGERKSGHGPKNGGKPRGGFLNDEEKPDFDNMTDEEKEAWEAEREAERQAREEEREAFKTALEEEDTQAIQDHLDDMLEKMQEHLDNLEEKLEEIKAEQDSAAQ